jgi:hypothetical protein
MIRIPQRHRIGNISTRIPTDSHHEQNDTMSKCSGLCGTLFYLVGKTDPEKNFSHVVSIEVHEVSRVGLVGKIFYSGQGRVVAPPK